MASLPARHVQRALKSLAATRKNYMASEACARASMMTLFRLHGFAAHRNV